MQAGLAKREPEVAARWVRENLYAQVQAATHDREPYRFIDGPPYANGDIHIGHALQKVLKDIVVKSRRLMGRHAPFTPGWDCHGLPIEHQVEKKHGKVSDKLDAKTFRAKCREYAAEQVERQRADFKRLGILADWDRPYLTMDPAFEAEQLRCLAKIVDNGHVVRGFKPVHWCLDCGSSLAEAEVEYEDKKSQAVDVAFAAVDAAEVLKRFSLPSPPAPLPHAGEGGPQGRERVGFVIWTTTPWTLPANQAIAVNRALTYALVRFERSGLVVLAADLVESTAKRYGESAQVLATVEGGKLEGALAQHPFAERKVPVICGEHVTLDAGTGLVHTAPAHGVEDYDVGRVYQLPVDNPVQSNGVYRADTPVVGGQHVRKAEEPILAALTSSGALLHRAEITHSFPHCWRHKSPLIFRATPQWFISMDQVRGRADAARSVRGQALAAIQQVKWVPGWGRERIEGMVAGRPDWCISRQRFWGVPMAVFTHREKQELHPQTVQLLHKVADAVEKNGLEAWFGSDAKDWLGAEAGSYEKSTDTLDVWFDSGVVHQCVFKANEPEALINGVAPVGDLYLEGSDQHRGWFQSSLLTSTAMHGRAPYRAVMTTGFTVDEQGRKMSKSLGNVVAPQEVFSTLGADVLRLWAAASDYSGEVAISKQLLTRMSDAYRRIRNTARYLLSNVHGFDPSRHTVAADKMLAVDRWALAQAATLQAEIVQAYEDYQFHLVYQKLHNYCVTDLGGLYLDLLKDRLYTTPADSLARRSAQTALFHIAEALVRWIAPILSFTADEIWEAMPGDRSRSVFSQVWHALPEPPKTDALDWPRLLSAREAVKKALEDLRIKGGIGSGLDAEVTLRAGGDMLKALQQPGEELRFWFITSAAHVEQGQGEELSISATACTHAKCERCWHRRADVGKDSHHPLLCGRCVSNISGAGEVRRFI
ncbi:MAG: isoleucine--tRNA ligase [Pseudomonadota bacterium]